MIASYILYYSIIQTKNGGRCFDNNGQQQFSCQCFETFIGSRCETDICEDFKCENGGICTIDESDPENLKPKCYCIDGFAGEICDIPSVCFNGDPCQNGGECKLLNGSNSSDQECCTFT